jgi:hypothetical protein
VTIQKLGRRADRGLRDGDGFIHNDSRYGNIHNTDQSMIAPLFHQGTWFAGWHHSPEGENGACELHAGAAVALGRRLRCRPSDRR